MVWCYWCSPLSPAAGWREPNRAPFFDFTGVQLTDAGGVRVCGGSAAGVAAAGPRDYLSTFLKIGTIVGLAIGILIMRPTLTMPALTKFVDGTGPVWTGNLFRSCLLPSPVVRCLVSTR